MGNWLTNNYNQDEQQQPKTEINNSKINYNDLDQYSKQQLIEYIQKMNPYHIQLDDDFSIKLKDLELDNTNLIPMSIELYSKMFQLLGKFKGPIEKNSLKRKQFFVKPKFDSGQIKIYNDSLKSLGQVIPIDTNLMKIPPTTVNMKMDDISLDEYNNSFNSILMKKDMIGINKKILRDMPQYLKLRFINAYNSILTNNSKTNNISIGKGSFIYKVAKGGAVTDINSFRQIISIPNAVNQFHRILTIRLTNYILANKYIDTNIQKGGISGLKFAIFEQVYKVKNILKHANKNHKSCCILFLDISNAYGNLNRESLCKILQTYHVDQKFINYFNSFYDYLEYYVTNDNKMSGPFKWKDGLIQGCSLSPLLFITALNYILTHIDSQFKNKYGYDLENSNKILLTAFVDDICLITKDTVSAEIVYNKLVELFKNIGLPISKEKTNIMIINDTISPTNILNEFKKVSVVKYLGEYVSSDGTATESYIQFLKLLSRKLIAIDKKNINFDIKIKLYESFVVPWIQRKTLAMYDIKSTERLKIIAIIKEYLTKWGHNTVSTIFSNIDDIISESKDAIISNVNFRNGKEIDDDLEKDIDIANYVLKDSNVKLEYNQIDDDFELDLELEELLS